MRTLTGIQPSGKLHWGNYFGAMRSMFDRQNTDDLFMFIANFHAMTTVRDGTTLRDATRDVALDYLACGLDPAKSLIYRQSDVPEVQELAWYLSCLTPMGLLERCHSYKDKMATRRTDSSRTPSSWRRTSSSCRRTSFPWAGTRSSTSR